jgi:hypothetical protein
MNECLMFVVGSSMAQRHLFSPPAAHLSILFVLGQELPGKAVLDICLSAPPSGCTVGDGRHQKTLVLGADFRGGLA